MNFDIKPLTCFEDETVRNHSDGLPIVRSFNPLLLRMHKIVNPKDEVFGFSRHVFKLAFAE
jgi:hypothetical protein